MADVSGLRLRSGKFQTKEITPSANGHKGPAEVASSKGQGTFDACRDIAAYPDRLVNLVDRNPAGAAKHCPLTGDISAGAMPAAINHCAMPALRLPVTGSSKPAAVKARTSKSAVFPASSGQGATSPARRPAMAAKSGCTLRTSARDLRRRASQPGPLSTQWASTRQSSCSCSASLTPTRPTRDRSPNKTGSKGCWFRRNRPSDLHCNASCQSRQRLSISLVGQRVSQQNPLASALSKKVDL